MSTLMLRSPKKILPDNNDEVVVYWSYPEPAASIVTFLDGEWLLDGEPQIEPEWWTYLWHGPSLQFLDFSGSHEALKALRDLSDLLLRQDKEIERLKAQSEKH